MFGARDRALALSLFAAAPFLGPALGPSTSNDIHLCVEASLTIHYIVIGGFLGASAGWRWVQGFLGIFTGVLLLMGFVLLPETYSPVLLRRRAAKLEKVTGKVYRAPQDVKGKPKITALLKTSLSRPWQFLFREAIVFLISLYVFNSSLFSPQR